MRIAPNHSRLRIIALACWSVGAWWMVQIGLLSVALFSTPMVVFMVLAGALLIALGVAFWVLSDDRQAGVVFDSKGLLLNLGHSAAFVCWNDIERLGTSSWRTSWLAIGSTNALGIRLRNSVPYLQSYEVRLPATGGLFGRALRLLQRLFASARLFRYSPSAADLARMRARTGYDVLVPEALLGGSAAAFVEIATHYRHDLFAQRA